MAIEIFYNGEKLEVSVDNSELMKEVKGDIALFGKDKLAYAIIIKKDFEIMSGEMATVEYIIDYQLEKEDLVDLQPNEYAVETTLSLLLKRLEKENSII